MNHGCLRSVATAKDMRAGFCLNAALGARENFAKIRRALNRRFTAFPQDVFRRRTQTNHVSLAQNEPLRSKYRGVDHDISTEDLSTRAAISPHPNHDGNLCRELSAGSA